MAVRGGYQQPSNPAPVSGPGAMSQRTDGGPADAQPIRVAPGGAYGERQEMAALQGSAPMAQAASMPMEPVPFDAPTQYPDEPVTAGAPVGDGPGPEALSIGSQLVQDASKMRAMLPVFEEVANSDPDYKAMRMFVRYLKGL